MTRARFITFEGIDGAGKSTHIRLLADRLRSAGASVVTTREPGGTELAETLRALVLQSSMDALTEALLVFAARRSHLRTLIEPALADGKTVLCDRFTDATFAYQGGGRGLELEVLVALERWVQQGRQPDLTLLFDVALTVAAQRRSRDDAPDRFERQDAAFFERVREGYLARERAAPQRFARIDSNMPVEAVQAQVVTALEARGW